MRLPIEGWLLIVSFLTFFFGYAAGRRIGRREGILEGIAFSPLEIRRRSWEKGACLICGTVAGESKSASSRVPADDAGAGNVGAESQARSQPEIESS